MASYKFGEIVLIKFPFTDNQSFKKRPALVIKDTHDGDIIVARITSKAYSTIYDVEIKDWNKNGLKLPSIIRVHKLASLENLSLPTKPEFHQAFLWNARACVHFSTNQTSL